MDELVAFDLEVLQRVMTAAAVGADEDEQALAAIRIFCYLDHPAIIVPAVAIDAGQEGTGPAGSWRAMGFDETEAGEFFMGCAAEKTRRYLDYHPDPRDCRLVAEAECAGADVLLVLREQVQRGLAGRAETVELRSPLEFWMAAGVTPGAPFRRQPAGATKAQLERWRW